MNSSTVDYFTRADCPGTFFRCERMSATISTASCAKMWKEANSRRKDPCDRLHRCQECHLGAHHAGEKITPANELYGAKICSRCHRPSSRLIHGEHCPSCYNRAREVLVGKNSKGTKPVKHPPLEPRRLLVACDGSIQVKSFPRTVDTAEAIVSVLRRMRGAVVFAFRGQIVRPTQLELF